MTVTSAPSRPGTLLFASQTDLEYKDRFSWDKGSQVQYTPYQETCYIMLAFWALISKCPIIEYILGLRPGQVTLMYSHISETALSVINWVLVPSAGYSLKFIFQNSLFSPVQQTNYPCADFRDLQLFYTCNRNSFWEKWKMLQQIPQHPLSLESRNSQFRYSKFPVFWPNFKIPCVFLTGIFLLFSFVFPVQWGAYVRCTYLGLVLPLSVAL